jgi:hypothetical protein
VRLVELLALQSTICIGTLREPAIHGWAGISLS